RIIAPVDTRAAAFARLFESVHAGVYIGACGPDATTTIAANPHLKLIFGYPSDAPEEHVARISKNQLEMRVGGDGRGGVWAARTDVHARMNRFEQPRERRGTGVHRSDYT